MSLGRDDQERIAAANEAAKHVENATILGIGSGRTVAKFIESLAKRIRHEGLDIKAVPTSYQTEILCVDHTIPLTSLYEYPRLDLAVDGADQVEKETFHMIKGGGGALLREKVVASASNKRIIIIEKKKLVDKLNQGIPIEVLPFATGFCLKELKHLGISRLRMASNKLGPVITDNGNYIIDLRLDIIEDPYQVEQQLKSIPGLVETGLFLDLADEVILGTGKDQVTILKR
jgi:ribose 5-phosphate isomerase A